MHYSCDFGTDPKHCDGYTRHPNRVRIIKEEGDGWQVDGIDTTDPVGEPTGSGLHHLNVHYTEAVHTFETWEEAIAFVPEFIGEVLADQQAIAYKAPKGA